MILPNRIPSSPVAKVAAAVNLQPKQVFKEQPQVRKFESGATRSPEAGKYDYEGFLSPLTLERFAEYMNKHRHQADGTLRASDNWQKGIPQDSYMKSLWRHMFDVWKNHRGLPTPESEEENLCAVIFNASGKLHEILRGNRQALMGADGYYDHQRGGFFKIGGTD